MQLSLIPGDGGMYSCSGAGKQLFTTQFPLALGELPSSPDGLKEQARRNSYVLVASTVFVQLTISQRQKSGSRFHDLLVIKSKGVQFLWIWLGKLWCRLPASEDQWKRRAILHSSPAKTAEMGFSWSLLYSAILRSRAGSLRCIFAWCLKMMKN